MEQNIPEYMTKMFEVLDKFDAEGFGSFLTEDCTFTHGNMPTVAGRAATVEFCQGFFKSIKGISHSPKRAIIQPGVHAIEGEVTYTRHDDTKLTLPFCNVFTMAEGDKIKAYNIYVDASQLHG